ncbi:MAG: hypothetical protein KatS3mg057_3132 [Herpetosiphonaceae bacterium]|nr:MAG: hypothetical protein KatS3mg057_3132 [Herpetosiphonaceae bacterium]
MATDDLIEILEQGIELGRISPYLASYIAATELKVWPDELDFDAGQELATEGAQQQRL